MAAIRVAGALAASAPSPGLQASQRQSPRKPLASARSQTSPRKLTPAEALARADEGRLRLPEFEWYLGPMYKRHAEILAERVRASQTGPPKKKVTITVPP